jgi:hypothetical protein
MPSGFRVGSGSERLGLEFGLNPAWFLVPGATTLPWPRQYLSLHVRFRRRAAPPAGPNLAIFVPEPGEAARPEIPTSPALREEGPGPGDPRT